MKFTQSHIPNAYTYTLPDSPVGQLKLFVGLHTTAVLKQKGQGVPGQVEDTARLSCVKHVDHVEPKVSL